MSGASAERVQVTTADGHVLEADIAPAATTPTVGAAVLCHPHPQYGGSRFDRVVTALFETLPARGVASLRFDFRRAYGGGVDERLDVIGAIDALADVTSAPRSEAPSDDHQPVPIHVVGYSFGAMVTLGVTDDRIVSRTLIAPPLPEDGTGVARLPSTRPTLLIVPEHDQFCPPDTARRVAHGWIEHGADVTVETIAMADHFLAGRSAAVADIVGDWLIAGSPDLRIR